jgi:hypothetical protein
MRTTTTTTTTTRRRECRGSPDDSDDDGADADKQGAGSQLANSAGATTERRG